MGNLSWIKYYIYGKYDENKRKEEITNIINQSIEKGKKLAKDRIKEIEIDLEKTINRNELQKKEELDKLDNELLSKKRDIDLETEKEMQRIKEELDKILQNKDIF